MPCTSCLSYWEVFFLVDGSWEGKFTLSKPYKYSTRDEQLWDNKTSIKPDRSNSAIFNLAAFRFSVISQSQSRITVTVGEECYMSHTTWRLFSIATTPRQRGGCYSIPLIAPLYPWSLPYNVVNQGGIKYYFLSLWYGLTWDWNPVSQTIGEHSTH